MSLPASIAPAALFAADQARQSNGPMRPEDPTRIEKAAQEFEAVFIGQILKPMFEGLSTDGPFGGGPAEETWRGFFLDAVADEVATAGGIGVADMVRAALLEADAPAMREDGHADG